MTNRRFGGCLMAALLFGTALVAGPGPAAATIEADMNAPRTVAVDDAGRVFVTDTDNHRILQIDPSGAVRVIAGTGEPGYGGDGGPATAARLWQPHGIAVDDAGNVYVADSPNHRIRRIDPAGIITTVAGTGRAAFSGDGGRATAAALNRPRNLLVDGAGNLIIADTGNYRVRRVDRNGIITTIAGTGVRGSSGDGGPATAARFNDPRDVALDGAGNLYVVDTEAHRVRMIDRAGTVTTVAGTGQAGFSGDGGPATRAQLYEPRGVAIDPEGNLFIADSSNNRARWVDRSGTIHTLVDSVDSRRLRDPRGLNTDRAGSVYVADTGNDRIIRVEPGGVAREAAGSIGGGGTAPPDGPGYQLVASDGGIFSFGDARFFGSTGGTRLNRPIVGMAPTPDGDGYWLVASDGGVFSFGDARFFGSTGGTRLNRPIVGMAPTPSGKGYWLVASDGGIFSFGDARFYGSAGALALRAPIVAMAPTPSGKGYWLVASDGGVFAYGDADFFGSTGGLRLAAPIVGAAATPRGRGYWLVASDGGVFTFGDAGFFGSAGGLRLKAPVVGLAATESGRGYWLAAADGGVFTYGDAVFSGSTGGLRLNQPIVGLAAGTDG